MLAYRWYFRRVQLYDMDIKNNSGNEPGKSNSYLMPESKMDTFQSEWPNVDIRHKHNYTKGDKFQKKITYEIPFWGTNLAKEI